MPKKIKIAVGGIALLFIVCGFVWWVLPVRFFGEVEPEEVAAIAVFNGNNGDEFEIASPDDISCIVSSIKQISFRKHSFMSGADYYYILTFLDKNGEEIDAFGLQNGNFLRRDDFFYLCNGELDATAKYLENLEAIRFPDYKKDPDFPYSD